MEISDSVLIAIIVAVPTVITSFIAPTIIAWQQHRISAAQKREDRAREDQVADRLMKRQDMMAMEARKAADALALEQRILGERTAEAAELLLASNADVAGAAKEARDSLAGQITGLKTDVKEVHVLVNSNLTKVTLALFEAVEGKLISMEESAETSKREGHKPRPALLEDIIRTKGKLEELRIELAAREKAEHERLAIIAAAP